MNEMPMQNLLPRFGINFLEDHARRIITDPKIALVELIANCWDAGANRVDITWPKESKPDTIKIKDDGTGMTSEEFAHRWLELNYNRKEVQGDDVMFPTGNQKSHRKAYGINGKGRHSMFCFTNEYKVETGRDGQASVFNIRRTGGISNTPYTISLVDSFPSEGHGTSISADLAKNYLEVAVIHDLIGSKFVVDPSFHVYLNGTLIELTSLKHLLDKREIDVKNYGKIFLSCVDSRKTGKTSRQHGVAWWVNNRLVGEPSWKGLDEAAYLDARTEAAKRYSFVVEADLLIDDVKEDWSGFKDTDRFINVQLTVRQHVLNWLNELLGDVHKTKKIAAVTPYKRELKELPLNSRFLIGRFIDELQTRVTVIDDKVLEATVEVMSKLEKTRTGYALLEQLAQLNSDDLEGLHDILENWSVQEARIVLDELGRRLSLVNSLEKLVENPTSDELHDIQPLFAQGLWIFGPEYESLQFLANRSLATIVRTFFNATIEKLKTPQRRPDFVALPDSSIGIYSHDAYDEQGDVAGIGKILIVELKKGGFEITRNEIRQASDYAIEIRNSGKISKNTEITGFVLGATLAPDAQETLKEGTNMCISSRPYSVILRRANARTFDLQKKIEAVKGPQLVDPEIEKAITTPEQTVLSL